MSRQSIDRETLAPEAPARSRPRRRARGARAALAALILAAALASLGALAPSARSRLRVSAACSPPPAAGASPSQVLAVLASGQDVWGERLLRAVGGPTLARARALLPPLEQARAAHQSSLTASGAYYLPFAEPVGRLGAGTVALDLADGSGIVAGHVGGRSLTIGVGRDGAERYGSCLAHLATPALAAGYLPILDTAYRDGAGARYAQESFAATVAGIGGLASFVRLRVDTDAARGPVEVRLTLSTHTVRLVGDRVEAGVDTDLLMSPGARLEGSSLVYVIPPGRERTLYAAFLDRPARVAHSLPPLARLYAEARSTEVSYWNRRLQAGASVAVPERTVEDAERALLIQNLILGYRYSVGNAYQEFSFPETIDVARVMGEWGFTPLDRAILDLSLTRRPTTYPNWTRGEELVGFAEYFRLTGDRRALARVAPSLARDVSVITRELASSGNGLLPREHYSSDIPLDVYGLPAQTLAWQGLEQIAGVFAATGRPALAAQCRLLARRLDAGIARAVASSERRLPDGSLFVPAMLLSGERPYAHLTDSRLGSYWNLVMPYALASGFFKPGGAQARGILDYLDHHGALLLGLVRAGAYALYGRHAPAPTSGTDEVYGVNLARFLADNDQASELVLSLYGQLAAAMTPGTFVSGEAASVAPIAGLPDRAMYLPPNSAANASLLETLRVMLVEETENARDVPDGLELDYATPPDWLSPGRAITVRRMPTSFGPISYTVSAGRRSIRVALDPPPRTPPALRLRVRLPAGERIAAVTLDGRPDPRVDRATATIDLTEVRGPATLVVTLG